MYSPTFEESRKYASEGYGAIPVSRTIPADVRTPIETLRALMNEDDHCYILESVEDRQRWGRYTILGFEPVLEFVCDDGKVRITEDGRTEEFETENPSEVIRGILADHRSPRIDGLPPFTGGLVGYFAYDYIRYAEPSLRITASDEEGFKDADLMLFDKVVVYDNFRQTVTVIAHADGRDIDGTYPKATEQVERIIGIIRGGAPKTHDPARLLSDFEPSCSEEQYCDMVKKAKDHIREGDIFQVVLSNRLGAEFEGSLLDVYRVLRMSNPSPYMFYLSGSDIEAAGASPETLVRLVGGDLHTFPLAGTRPMWVKGGSV